MITLGTYKLDLHDIQKIAYSQEKIEICEKAEQEIHDIYNLIQHKAAGDQVIYGLNTGFGALAEQKISYENQAILQRNIILSHAVGVGDPLAIPVARALMLLRLNTLVKAHSGASPALIALLCQLINQDCAAFIPKKGSVGASGDLAPLAHMGLLLLGIGQAYYKTQLCNASDLLAGLGLQKLNLGIRDGLALINGTQAMAAQGALSLIEAKKLADLADINISSSLEALAGHKSAFDVRIHELKPYQGQIQSAAYIRKLTEHSVIRDFVSNALTQDPYSLRCAPQVHGASRDVMSHAQDVIIREMNSVTDNPLIFLDNQELNILSGGNFHGQALALALDYLAMGVAELANISERRIELLLNPRSSHGLPAFLAPNSGLNSGYMMLHVTASALVSENKILCHPASVDSIPTSANREDHVSMGMSAANKLCEVINNTKTVLAIELLAAHQALDFRKAKTAGKGVQQVHDSLRTAVDFRNGDGLYIQDLAKALSWLDQTDISNFLV
jgi:histidine ammonia-lyase